MMMANRSNKKTAWLFAAFIVGLMLLLLFGGKSGEPVYMEMLVAKENDHGSALIEVANPNDEIIRLDRYCTLYWTNAAGVATNQFYIHGGENSELKPNDSIRLAIPHPVDARVWQVSFTFYVVPSWIERVGNLVKGESFRNRIPPNDFHGRLSPLITNAAFLELSRPLP